MATSNEIEFYAGEDVVIDGTIVDAADAAVDITGWAMSFKIFPGHGRRAFITKTVGSGITITNGPLGLYTIVLAAADSSGIGPNTCKLLLERTDAGFDSVLAVGDCTIKAKK